MVVSLDEWICDYIPQIVTTAIATIITGELTELICIQEHYNIKVDNLKWSEDQITSQIEFWSHYKNQKNIMAQIENDNLENSFVKTI